MRFIGNKELIAPQIRQILADEGLLDRGLTFFDAFCGTGAVSEALKDSVHIKANDILEWCGIYTRGRLSAPLCTFKALGHDPFEFLATDRGTRKGFFFKNYSPGNSDRMYFTAGNAARIDYIRHILDEWHQDGRINDNEFSYLIASLIESVSMVANTAGVYGAFLKHWDPRAKRELIFQPVKSRAAAHGDLAFYNNKIEDIIADVDCDILYLDPPYTQNQYGTQYHILETLVKNDAPPVSKITGSRPTSPMRSDWSKDIRKQILFDAVIANTKAEYIVCSYSSDGFMSKAYIESVLRRYGEPDTLKTILLSHGNYTNFKSRGRADHLEYLFFVRKRRPTSVQFVSPLNYIGSKTRMIEFLKPKFPANIGTFFDLFGGGFNVGVNVGAEKIIYNDYNHIVKNLMQTFRDEDTYEFIKYVRRQIAKFGLEKENSTSYTFARDYFNSLAVDKRDPRLLYTIIMYGFNQQIRFNGNLDFNNPVGQRWFNEKVLEKLISFSRALKARSVEFRSLDFAELIDEMDARSFVYMDPPYRLTTGTYNDGKRGFKGWNLEAEKRLFIFAEQLNKRGIRFMMSYVGGHKGLVNGELTEWVKRNSFKVVECPKTQGVGRRELVILNYELAQEASLRDQKPLSKRRYDVSKAAA